MKTKIFYPFAICLLAICSWACNEYKPNVQGLNSLSVSTSDSLTFRALDPTSYQIDNDSAKKYISNYVKYINTVKRTLSSTSNKFPDNAKKLNYGVKVDLKELKEILTKSSPNAELYLMMGIMESDSTEIIFSLKSNPIVENTMDTMFWRFFDFTQPCPAACPKLSDIEFKYID